MICWAICSLSSAVSTRPANASQRAIAIAPLLAGSYYDLVRCRPVTSDDDGLLQRMEAALATPGLEAAQRLRLHLAIGKAADDLGDYALAMQHFDAADAVRRGSASFDSAAFSIEIDRLIARCTPELIARAPELGSRDATPVLIIGMPRSGTTLVEQIVSMHPEVGAGDELNFWNERGAAWHRSGAAGNETPFLAKAAADYLGVLRAIAPKAARVTDKMPFNFLWAGLIHLAFPRAIIIHCRRAAVDTALSIHQTHFHPGLAFPTGGAELVAYFRSYQRLIDHWRSVLPADRFIEVDYEELTRAPEPVIRRIIAACGLAWHDACLRPESQSAGCEDPQQVADPAADLSHLRRALATLRTLAGAPARARRRRVGTGRGYRPIVIGLKQPLTGKTRRNLLETASA